MNARISTTAPPTPQAERHPVTETSSALPTKKINTRDPYTEIRIGRSGGRLQQNCDLPASQPVTASPKLRGLGRLILGLACGFVGGGAGCSVDGGPVS